MAYSRYATEMKDGDNNIYGLMDEEARAQLSDLNSAYGALCDDFYSENGLSGDTVNGLHIKTDGTREDIDTYKCIKFAITAGKVYRVINNDNWQFQSASNIPSTGTNRVGLTYSGSGYAVAPEGATYLIVSCLKTYTPYVYELYNEFDERIERLNNSCGKLCDDFYSENGLSGDTVNGFHIKTDGTREDIDTYKCIKFAITAGKFYKVTNNDNWQFQSSSTIPSTGTNRVGFTYNGSGYAVAPEGATHLIVSCLKTYAPQVYELYAEYDEQIKRLNNSVYAKTGLAVTETTGFRIKYDGTREDTQSYKLVKTPITAGKYYYVNTSDNWQFQSSSSVPSSGSNRIGYTYHGAAFAVAPVGSTYIVASSPVSETVTISLLQDNNVGSDIEALKLSTQVDANNENLWEQGNIDSSGNNGVPSSATYNYRIRTKTYIDPSILKMIRHRPVLVFRYTLQGVFVDYTSSVSDIYVFDHANYKYRVSIPGTNNLVSNCSAVSFYGEKIPYNYTPMARFTYPDEINAIDASGFDFTVHQDNYCYILEDVYDAFDALMALHPTIITKSDVAEFLGMTYPSYATGGDGTPAYKTYMYTIKSTNDYAGNNGNVKKKKLLLTGGVHGNEIAAPVNVYFLIKSIINMETRDMFSLLSAFDIYVIPCVNGWGMYHLTRINANGVNINRNFPVANWVKSGNPGESNYTGEEAGDQFETQLVMGITEYLKPDMCIDHHNYGTYNNRQFYSESSHTDVCNASYQALQDCAFAFIKNLPQYFGTNYNLFIQIGGSVPAQFDFSNEGKTQSWWYEQPYIPFSAIIEISACINYWAGEYKTQGRDLYGSDSFGVGLFTLQNVLCHYAEHLLKNLA